MASYSSGLDQTSIIMGWLAGRAIASQRKKQEKEPVAHLYNGVKLPPKPEWDKEAYPYATIDYTKISDTEEYYHFIISSIPFLYNASTEVYEITNTEYYSAKVNVAKGETSWTEFAKGYASYRRTYLPPVWTNYDLTLKDGGVLNESDPVPVYL